MKPHLKFAPDAMSPERAALAVAIADAAPIRAVADKARAASEKSRGVLAAAIEAGPAAERAADAARARAVDDPSADRAELRSARQAAADAADDVGIAKEIAKRAEDALIEAERSARYAAERVEAAADAVLASVFPAALDAAQRAGREAATSAFAVEAIASFGNSSNGERGRRESDAAVLNARIRFGGSDLRDVDAARQAAQAPWLAARTALIINSAAPLPAL